MTIAPARPTPAAPTRSDPARREPAPDVANDEFDRIMERHADAPRRDDPAQPSEPHARRRTETADEPSGDERTEHAPGRSGSEHRPGVGGTDRDAADPTGSAPRPTDTSDLAPVTPPVPTTGATPAAPSAPPVVDPSPVATTVAGASAPPAATSAPSTTATPAPAGPTTTATPAPAEPTTTATPAPAEPTPTAPTGTAEDPSVVTRSVAPAATVAGASGDTPERPAPAAAATPGGAATTGPTPPTSTPDPAGTPGSTTADGAAVVLDGDADPASTTPTDGPPEPGPVRVESSPATAPAPERPGSIGDARPIAGGRPGAPEHRSEPVLHADTGAPHADDLLARAELRRVTGRGSRLDIGLSTSDLGRIEVAAVDRGNGLQLQLTSDQPDARRHLTRHLDELRGDLADAGLDVGSLDVGDSPRHGRQPDRPAHSGAPAGPDRAPAGATRPTHAVGAGRPVPERIEVTDGLDLRL